MGEGGRGAGGRYPLGLARKQECSPVLCQYLHQVYVRSLLPLESHTVVVMIGKIYYVRAVLRQTNMCNAHEDTEAQGNE